MAFADTLRTLNGMKEGGVIEEYAIAGAIALAFWSEPIATYDLDVLVFLPPAPGAGLLTGLDGIYRWTGEHGYAAHREHVIIEGVPTQFFPSPDGLADEAIETAKTMDYEGVPTRVVVPEYLVALYLQPAARTPTRRERAARLLEWPGLDQRRLVEILERHGLSLDEHLR